jgi:arsenate reductase
MNVQGRCFPAVHIVNKRRVLFICTQNAGRSQMAEGYLRSRYGDRYLAFSAGTNPGQVSRKAMSVMQEIGVDISGHWSKPLSALVQEHIDLAVILSDHAALACPVCPFATKTIHHAFADPGALTGRDEAVMEGIRRIRDDIASWIDAVFGDINAPESF